MVYDFVIVGGGSAGCVAAGRLARETGAKVLLLESGGTDRSMLVDIPAGLVKLMRPKSRFYTEYPSVPQPQLNGRSPSILQANVLGGGSSVNAMTYTRGSKSDYDRWDAELGGAGWSWNDMLPYFIRQESNQRLGAPSHGTQGSLKVSDPHHPISRASRSFLLAMQECGIPFTTDFNSGVTTGAGVLQSTTFHGQRWSSARAFLPAESTLPNLEIKLNAKALRVSIENSRAVGVEYLDADGSTRLVKAGQVILTAGCFASAQLLMLSGVGSSEALKAHGIRCVADLPGVGQGIQDHNDVRIGFNTEENYGYSNQDRGLSMIWNGLQYLAARSGPATSTGSEVTAFIDPSNFSADPTIQFYCLGKLAGHTGRAPNGFTLVANLIAPKSRGSMTLRSANPLDLPLLDLRWLTAPEDLDNLVAGAELLFRIASVSPMRELIRSCIPFPKKPTREELVQYIRSVTGTNWHPVSSCRMGRADDPNAVVDTQLRVIGIDNLRVFDGSVMPRIIGANTNAPIMAIADRGVDFLLASPPSSSAADTPVRAEQLH